jgi:hypothetical protein
VPAAAGRTPWGRANVEPVEPPSLSTAARWATRKTRLQPGGEATTKIRRGTGRRARVATPSRHAQIAAKRNPPTVRKRRDSRIVRPERVHEKLRCAARECRPHGAGMSPGHRSCGCVLDRRRPPAARPPHTGHRPSPRRLRPPTTVDDPVVDRAIVSRPSARRIARRVPRVIFSRAAGVWGRSPRTVALRSAARRSRRSCAGQRHLRESDVVRTPYGRSRGSDGGITIDHDVRRTVSCGRHPSREPKKGCRSPAFPGAHRGSTPSRVRCTLSSGGVVFNTPDVRRPGRRKRRVVALLRIAVRRLRRPEKSSAEIPGSFLVICITLPVTDC